MRALGRGPIVILAPTLLYLANCSPSLNSAVSLLFGSAASGMLWPRVGREAEKTFAARGKVALVSECIPGERRTRVGKRTAVRGSAAETTEQEAFPKSGNVDEAVDSRERESVRCESSVGVAGGAWQRLLGAPAPLRHCVRRRWFVPAVTLRTAAALQTLHSLPATRYFSEVLFPFFSFCHLPQRPRRNKISTVRPPLLRPHTLSRPSSLYC